MNPATRFLQTLFAPYPPDAGLMAEIRPLWPAWKEAELYPEGGAPWWWRSATKRRQWFPMNRIDVAAHHALKACGDSDVYVGVLPRIGRKGGRYDVRFAAWLWCDVDGGDAGPDASVELVKQSGLPRPHLAVMSGSGIHVYWRLSKIHELPGEAACDTFKETLRRLVMAIGGAPPLAHADSTRADTASILRVPETLNWKRQEEPRFTRLLRCAPEAEAKSLAWWGANLPPIPLPPAPAYAATLQPGETRDLPQKAMQILEGTYPPGTRHHALLELLAIARGVCCYDEAALMILAEHFRARNDGSTAWMHMMVRSTLRRIQPHY